MRPLADSDRLMAVTFSADGLISSLSSSAEQITGYSAHELVGHSITQIVGDKSVFEVPSMLNSAREWGAWDGEIVHRDRSGRCLNAWATITPLTGRRDIHTGFLLVSSFHESRGVGFEGEKPLQEVAARLRTVSHELNNPLAVMMGFAQLIMLSPHCGGRIRGDMEKLYVELKRVIQVVEKLHGYARSLEGERKSESLVATG